MNNLAPSVWQSVAHLESAMLVMTSPPISSLKKLLVKAANRSQRTFCSVSSAASFQKRMLRTLRHIQSRYLKSHCTVIRDVYIILMKAG